MYVIDQTGKRPIFQINQHIGFDKDIINDDGTIEEGDGQGIDGRIFANEFFETDLLSPNWIDVYVNTMGGDVQQSLCMLTAITRVKSKTKGIISGFAYSCGGWIPMGCDIIHMVEHASWMCHLPYNPEDPNQKSEFLDAVLNMVATIISSKSGRNGKPKKTVQEVKDMMVKKTYMNATQMYNAGLIDDVIGLDGKIISAPKEENFAWNYDTDYKEIKNFYKEKQVALNKYFNKQKNIIMPYPKLANRLNAVKAVNFNLTEDASEDVMIEAVAKLENKINNLSTDYVELAKIKDGVAEQLIASNAEKVTLQKRLSEMQSAKDAMDTDIVNMKKTIENMEADNSTLKASKKEFEDSAKNAEHAAKTVKATVLIDGFIKTGKITASNKEELDSLRTSYIDDAVDNFEKTKRYIDMIPVSMSLPRPDFGQPDPNAIDGGDGSIKHFQALNKAKNDAKLSAWLKENPAFS